jgi:hypothetical protein
VIASLPLASQLLRHPRTAIPTFLLLVRLLVAEAERWAREKGAEGVVVRSNAQRVESHLFYPALGFQESKRQVVYRKNF